MGNREGRCAVYGASCGLSFCRFLNLRHVFGYLLFFFYDF